MSITDAPQTIHVEVSQSRSNRFKKMVDWGMFSLGALSLTVAIGGTILGQFDGPAATASSESQIATTVAG